MNLEQEVRDVVCQSKTSLTVEDVTREIADRLPNEIRSILNALVKKEEMQYFPGGGGYEARYGAPPKRRL
jgi:hypothetical protein